MPKIDINFLQHRRKYIPLLGLILRRIKPELKKNIRINFLMTEHFPDEYFYSVFKDGGIEYRVVNFGGHVHTNNYTEKMHWMINQDADYIVKLDEDVFFSHHVWNFMLENISVLDDDRYILLSPITSIGVHSCEYFVEDFCNDEEKRTFRNILLKVDLQKTAGDRWGVDIEHLNDFTIRAKSWNPKAFLRAIDKLSIKTKGIHPVRFDYSAQSYINGLVLNNIGKFMRCNNMSIIDSDHPYLCNDVSVSTMKTYREIYNTYGFNPYDEIEMNELRRKKGQRFAFISNGFAVHTLFAFVSRFNQEACNYYGPIEQSYYDNIFDKIKQYYHFDLE